MHGHVWCALHIASASLVVHLPVYWKITPDCSCIPKHIAMTSQWVRWRLKSPASSLFTQPFIQAQIKKHQSSASFAFVRGIPRWPVNSPHICPVTRKMFPFDDVIMIICLYDCLMYWFVDATVIFNFILNLWTGFSRTKYICFYTP